MIKIGDKRQLPVNMEGKSPVYTGTCIGIYKHFALFEFEINGSKIRECFKTIGGDRKCE